MMERWNTLAIPPAEALKEIKGGRMSGKTDINPQWRYKAMTEVYGECGVGWKWEIVDLWTLPGSEEQTMCFARVNVYTKQNEDWSDPIPGVGGSMLIEMERNGLHTSDEGFKMAVTDALSVALKFLGVASKVYEGQLETKYGKPNGKKPVKMEEPGDYVMPMGKTKGKKLSDIPDKDLRSAMKWIDGKRKEDGKPDFYAELYEHIERHLNGNIGV